MKKRVPRPIPASKFLGSHDKRVVGTSRSWQSDDILTGAELSAEPAEPEAVYSVVICLLAAIVMFAE